MSPGLVLNAEDCPAIPDPRRQRFYRSFLVKLRFAASWIRFDTSFTVSSLARFCNSAGPSHWAALHHLMEYLEGFPSFKLTYRRRTGVDDGLSGFADADWGNSSSRRSTSGNLCLYNRSPISWRSKQQKTTALTTAEAEYYDASTEGRQSLQRSCTSATFSSPWASPNRARLRCTRTTLRASSGGTTSSVDVSAPSISTFGSTSPAK
jgi:hypothetical protein